MEGVGQIMEGNSAQLCAVISPTESGTELPTRGVNITYSLSSRVATYGDGMFNLIKQNNSMSLRFIIVFVQLTLTGETFTLILCI